MINHSTLARELQAAVIDGKPLPASFIIDIINLTRHGVIMEAGPLAKNAKGAWRADSLLKGFRVSVDAPVNQEMAAAPKPAIIVPNGFLFGVASEKEMVGVDPRLVKCAHLALARCLIDFCCYDGIRSYKEQAQHVRDGTSKTMESKHLRGLALDLVPWMNGKPTWDWEGCYQIALAMDSAATELGIANLITWGGAWDRRLSDFGGDAKKYADEVQAYRARHPGSDFIDGPHFEIRS